MNKNAVFWIEALFAILSLWVLFFVGSYPEHALLALRIYVLALIFITLGLVLAVRYFQSQHSTIDIDRICDMVRRVDVPAAARATAQRSKRSYTSITTRTP